MEVGRTRAPGSTGSRTYVVLIRGPLGVGKTTVARRLARGLGAEYISIDRLLDDHGLWYSGRLAEFLRANRHAVRRARTLLGEGTPVVIDGNFYWRSQIGDLVGRLDFPHAVFTLRAPESLCILRDRHRHPSHGAAATRQVYAKSTRFEYGIGVDATKPVDRVVSAIRSALRAAGFDVRPRAPRRAGRNGARTPVARGSPPNP